MKSRSDIKTAEEAFRKLLRPRVFDNQIEIPLPPFVHNVVVNKEPRLAFRTRDGVPFIRVNPTDSLEITVVLDGMVEVFSLDLTGVDFS